ncbi:polysaccharide biosynthesis/export family protein [Planctomycetota bacterium]
MRKLGMENLSRYTSGPMAAVMLFLLIGISLSLIGCDDKFLDPTQIGRFRPVPAVNVILDSLGVADETPSVWEGAEDPKPADVIALETDYVFGSGDFVSIAIFELLAEGQMFENRYIISETGKISIQEVGVVEIAGLTESQAEETIIDIVKPTLLIDPLVTVTLLNSQDRLFSISGNAVPRPGRIPIPRHDYRLLDALAEAGVETQFNVSYIFVSRAVSSTDTFGEPTQTTLERDAPQEQMLEIIAPYTGEPHDQLVVTIAELITPEELAQLAGPEDFETDQADEIDFIDIDIQNALDDSAELVQEQQNDEKDTKLEWIFKDGKWVPVSIEEQSLPDQSVQVQPEISDRETIKEPIDPQTSEQVEWVFQNGKWVPIIVGQPRKVADRAKRQPPKVPGILEGKLPETREVGDWEQTQTAGMQARVIKIATDKLTGGDPRYNIVIKPGDSIQVPLDIIGEFAIMGNINRVGYVNITGRPMTLKMAVAAAGGLGPLAWPKRVEVIRRIGKNKEETVMVNLEKIASGEQPDFFIKPNDLINVGTHPTARFRAVIRNAFRASYGFGFVYDRNFVDRELGLRHPLAPFGF